MIDLNHPSNIVPNGIEHATVKPVNFAVRTMVDYDMKYLRDRLRADVFIDGKPAGVYACVAGFDGLSAEEALRTLGPEVERQVIDEFMGLGYRKRVRQLEVELRHLRAFVDRDRWFHFVAVRRAYAKARLRASGRLP